MHDRLVQLMIGRHVRRINRERRRARQAEQGRQATTAIMIAAGVDPDEALVGAPAISALIGIQPRTLRKWRGENRFGLADVVLQGPPGGPVFASRRQVLAIRAALQAEQVARTVREPTQQLLITTGARAMVLAALRCAGEPLTATQIAERCPGVDPRRSIRPELARLVKAGALRREQTARISPRGPKSVWAYSIGDARMLARFIDRGRRSRAAADRILGSEYAPANATAGTSGTRHGYPKPIQPGKSARALAILPTGPAA